MYMIDIRLITEDSKESVRQDQGEPRAMKESKGATEEIFEGAIH